MDLLHKVNWQKGIDELCENEKGKAEVDEAMKAHGVFYKPHDAYGNVQGQWPYLISKTARIDVTGDIKMGPFFMMNDGAVILRHKHPIYQQVPMMMQCLWKTEPNDELVIEEDVWLQRNSIIMPNVTHVHKGTLLAVGSTLTKNTTCEYGIWAGTPAKLLRLRELYEIPQS